MNPTELNKAAGVLRNYNNLIMALRDYHKDKWKPDTTTFNFYGWPCTVDTSDFAELAEKELNEYRLTLSEMGVYLDPSEVDEAKQQKQTALTKT